MRKGTTQHQNNGKENSRSGFKVGKAGKPIAYLTEKYEIKIDFLKCT